MSRWTFIHGRKCARSLATVLLLIFTACNDDNGLVEAERGPLTRDDLVGAYVATTLLVTVGAEEIDILNAGGDLVITLEQAGTTTGELFVPEGLVEEEISADLVGAWVFQSADQSVIFQQTADTFVRDLTLLAVCGAGGTIELRADEILGDNRFRVVLTRMSTIQFPVTSCPEGTATMRTKWAEV